MDTINARALSHATESAAIGGSRRAIVSRALAWAGIQSFDERTALFALADAFEDTGRDDVSDSLCEAAESVGCSA